MLDQLAHSGVVVPNPPSPIGLALVIRGIPAALTPKQEEMALAWAKKKGTPYVEDPTFVRNFMTDFSQELGLEEVLSVDEVGFGPAIEIIEAEREARAQLTREERKALAAERKARREALREQYGYAIVNGERVEVANYVVEPSSIFMGRGEHPLRGRWKEGARQGDVTLNLSPDAPRPAGDWAEVVWEPESLWIARWRDRLSGKMKYVWLSDTAPIKQERERQKYDQAHELHAHLDLVREQIGRDLANDDPKIRMIATACYLIDVLCLRVGDEKDADEADTVGATTLRPEHVRLHEDGLVEFSFLGKDSVPWHKRVTLPEEVRRNLEELTATARPPNTGESDRENDGPRSRPQLFHDIGSRDVNVYLSGILPGLTAKVFRTHHTTMVVQESLAESGVRADHPEHKKWEAASRANVEAAILCNHTKKPPASWPNSRQRYKARLRKARDRVQTYLERVKGLEDALSALRQEAREKLAAATPGRRDSTKARYDKRIERAKARIERTRGMLRRARLAVGKIKAQASIAAKKRTLNLGTSLKSYIDPRVYHSWGQEVEYDVLERYYPKALRSKFSWARDPSEEEQADAQSEE